MSAFILQKISIFLNKNTTLHKEKVESCVRDLLVLFSVFVREKVAFNKNVSFTDYASGIQLPSCPKLAVNCKNNNDVTFW